MPSLLPSADTLSGVFGAKTPIPASQNTSFDRTDIFRTWSVADDAKVKAQQLTNAVKPDSGKIELYSPKFYASSVFGGLLACVSSIEIDSC